MLTARKAIQHTQEHAISEKKEREIVEVKYKRNISFSEARQVVEVYKKGFSYTRVTENKITNNASQPDIYRALIEKFIHLAPNDWHKS